MDRRSFLRGLISAPAVVAGSSIMPVRSIERLIFPPAAILKPGTWHHVTVVRSTANTRFFLDGRECAPFDAPFNIERLGIHEWLTGEWWQKKEATFTLIDEVALRA